MGNDQNPSGGNVINILREFENASPETKAHLDKVRPDMQKSIRQFGELLYRSLFLYRRGDEAMAFPETPDQLTDAQKEHLGLACTDIVLFTANIVQEQGFSDMPEVLRVVLSGKINDLLGSILLMQVNNDFERQQKYDDLAKEDDNSGIASIQTGFPMEGDNES